MSGRLFTRRFVGITTTAAMAAGFALSALSAAAPASAVEIRSTAGLFGSADPTYDGVYRQSWSIVALAAAKAPIPPASVSWLATQQCANGSFDAYRANPAVPCKSPDPANFTGPDSNSTALAAMALQAAGKPAQASRAVAALIRTQNADGGWGYTLGGASDVNSTGLALAAVKGVSVPKGARAAINRATGYLTGVQIPCSAPANIRFGMPFQAGQAVNPLASAQSLIGVAGTLPATAVRASSVRNAACSATLEQKIASFLEQLLRNSDGGIIDVFDSTKTDWNATVNAVIALGAAGGARAAVATGLKALGANVVPFAGSGANASPAALAALIEAAVVGGQSPRRFGTPATNLVASLLATVQK